jgi:hypothetical protein
MNERKYRADLEGSRVEILDGERVERTVDVTAYTEGREPLFMMVAKCRTETRNQRKRRRRSK